MNKKNIAAIYDKLKKAGFTDALGDLLKEKMAENKPGAMRTFREKPMTNGKAANEHTENQPRKKRRSNRMG